MSGSGTLFHADHPRRLIPELSANAHNAGWFVGIGSGGFFSIKQGDSVYVAASNVVKNRLVADDLFVYKVNDSSVALSPQSDRKLDPCEIIGLLMLIYKERRGTGAVLHSNGQDPVLASLVYTGTEFKIKNQGAIRGIYNEQLRRNYTMDEELTVPIVNVATEAALRQAIRQNPHANAVIVRNQGMFVWAENWQKCQAMAESYHLLTGISVQMEKLGLNVYTHDVTAADISSMNVSVNSATASASTASTNGSSKAVVGAPAASKTAPAAKPAAPAAAAPAKASSTPAAAAKPATPSTPKATTSTPTSATANKKTPNGVNKVSPLKKTSSQRGGKVMKRGGRGGARGRGGVRASPGPMAPRASPGPMGPPPMMGPDPFAGGPVPMGMMAPPMMMGPPMMGGPPGPPHRGGGRGGARGGARGRGGAKRGGGRGGGAAGPSGDKKNFTKGGKKAGMSKNMLMNY